MEEIWKEIKGFEELYHVSNLGRVKSIKKGRNRTEKILSPAKYKYLGVYLFRDKKKIIKYIHQLVAESFLDHKPCGFKKVVNHKNFNKYDNRVINLEIVSQRENANKKHIKSSSQYTGVSWSNTNKAWVARIYTTKGSIYLGQYLNEIDAHNAYQDKLKKELILNNIP